MLSGRINSICLTCKISSNIWTYWGLDGFPPGFRGLPCAGERGHFRKSPAGTDGFVSGLPFDREAAPSEKEMYVLLRMIIIA